MPPKKGFEHNYPYKGVNDDDDERSNKPVFMGLTKKQLLGLGSIAGATALTAFLFSRYKICKPNQYLVKTGIFIPDMTVSKRTFVLPFQMARYVNMTPFNCTFKLHNMSKEKVEFELPMVFTLGPIDPMKDLDKFKNYARTSIDFSADEIKETVKGVIHGECRILAAGMTIEEMFADRNKFRDIITGKVQDDLDKFGLTVYNSNVEEMGDLKGNEYFQYRRKRALEGAINDAKVDVAEAQKHGEVGESGRKADAKKEIARINAEAIKTVNEQQLVI